jgi:hypothetical protein
VFVAEARVPVDGAEVEGEGAIAFVLRVSTTSRLLADDYVRTQNMDETEGCCGAGLTTVATKSGSPANTSISKYRYSAWMVSSLLTIVRIW